MILILLFFIFFFNYIKCDIPVHCVSRHVEGVWEINLGLLKKNNSENADLQSFKKNTLDYSFDNNTYDYDCGYIRPDTYKHHDNLNPEKLKEKFELKNKRYIVFNNDRTINITENNIINYAYSGYWRLIYDEGIYIEIYKYKKNKEVYFSFFKFKKQGNISYSYCSNLIMGMVYIYSLNYDNINKHVHHTVRSSNMAIENEYTDFSQSDHINGDNVFKNRKYLNNKKTNMHILQSNMNNFEIKSAIRTFKISYNDSGSFPKEKNKTETDTYFYELIDYYNDNFINSEFLTIEKYCWYGKKLNKTSDDPTNKIPSDIISPLILNVRVHNKNYETSKLKIEKHMKEIHKGIRGRSVERSVEESEEPKEELKDIIKIQINKQMKKNLNLNLSNKNTDEKYKKNSLFNIYSNKIITLANFDWANENDVKNRLGHFVKIINNNINQKKCGSCYANSAALIINSRIRIKYHYIKNIDVLSFSRNQLIACDYFNQGCSGGYIFISLKYAYENFLYTNQCFKKYIMKYENLKVNSFCGMFDTYKNILYKENNKMKNIENDKKEEKDEPHKVSILSAKNKELPQQIEIRINRDVKTHIYNNKNLMNSSIIKNSVYEEVHMRDDSKNDDNNQEREDELNGDYIIMNKKVYDSTKLDINDLNSCDAKIKVKKYEYLFLEDEEALKKYIYYNGPVAVAIEPSIKFLNYKKGILFEDFIKLHDGNKSNAYIWTKVDHAVVIVGWGEDTLENFMEKNNLDDYDMVDIYDKKEENKNRVIKYWKALNSWGKKWGTDGYFYILRNKNFYNMKAYILACDANLFIKKIRTQ